MEQQVNPYEAGDAHQQGYVDPSVSVVVTPVALGALTGTKFWVSLVGVGMLIVVVIQLAMMIFINANAGGVGSSAVLIGIQVLSLAIYVILAIRLLQYGKAIKRLSSSSNNADLERAMVVQTKFWRLLGIMCIIMFVLFIVGIIASALMINSAASNFR